ncbi:MAG: DUF559 domain-containing protein [Myxococcaceae bacterium]
MAATSTPIAWLDLAFELRPDENDLIWHLLRDRQLGGVKFKRGYAWPPHTLPFYAPEVRLCVELERQQSAARAAALDNANIATLRIASGEVFDRPNAVLQTIWNAVLERRRGVSL